LAANRAGVHGGVREEEARLARRRVEFHLCIRVDRALRRRSVEVEDVIGVAKPHKVHVEICVTRDLGVVLVHGKRAGKSARDDAGLLLVEIILMARSGKRLAG
jgi:hypothetical protein